MSEPRDPKAPKKGNTTPFKGSTKKGKEKPTPQTTAGQERTFGKKAAAAGLSALGLGMYFLGGAAPTTSRGVSTARDVKGSGHEFGRGEFTGPRPDDVGPLPESRFAPRSLTVAPLLGGGPVLGSKGTLATATGSVEFDLAAVKKAGTLYVVAVTPGAAKTADLTVRWGDADGPNVAFVADNTPQPLSQAQYAAEGGTLQPWAKHADGMYEVVTNEEGAKTKTHIDDGVEALHATFAEAKSGNNQIIIYALMYLPAGQPDEQGQIWPYDSFSIGTPVLPDGMVPSVLGDIPGAPAQVTGATVQQLLAALGTQVQWIGTYTTENALGFPDSLRDPNNIAQKCSLQSANPNTRFYVAGSPAMQRTLREQQGISEAPTVPPTSAPSPMPTTTAPTRSTREYEKSPTSSPTPKRTKKRPNKKPGRWGRR